MKFSYIFFPLVILLGCDEFNPKDYYNKYHSVPDILEVNINSNRLNTNDSTNAAIKAVEDYPYFGKVSNIIHNGTNSMFSNEYWTVTLQKDSMWNLDYKECLEDFEKHKTQPKPQEQPKDFQ